MAKKKHPITRLHKIKVHKNRWLSWAIAYAVIVAIALIGYIKVSDINFDSENVANTQLQSLHSFRDQQLGFLVRYPVDWSIEADSNSSVTFVPSDTADQGVSVSVMKLSEEKAFRKVLKIVSETQSQIDDQTADMIVNNLGKGSYETVVLSHFNNQLYVVRGTDSLVRKLLLTFRFISK